MCDRKRQYRGKSDVCRLLGQDRSCWVINKVGVEHAERNKMNTTIIRHIVLKPIRICFLMPAQCDRAIMGENTAKKNRALWRGFSSNSFCYCGIESVWEITCRKTICIQHRRCSSIKLTKYSGITCAYCIVCGRYLSAKYSYV